VDLVADVDVDEGSKKEADRWERGVTNERSSVILPPHPLPLTHTRTLTHGVSVLTNSAVRGKGMGTGRGMG